MKYTRIFLIALGIFTTTVGFYAIFGTLSALSAKEAGLATACVILSSLLALGGVSLTLRGIQYQGEAI